MVTVSEAFPTLKLKDTSLAASENIRVLLVITGLATGGATNVVLELASHFNERPGFDLDLVTGPIPPGRTDVTYMAYDRGIPTQVIPNLVNHISPVTNLKAVRDLRRIMIEGHYDIVHTHSSVAGIVGRIAALSAGIPVIVHHVHGWGLHDGMSSVTKQLYLQLERFCARFTDRIIAVSGPDIQKGLERGIGRQDKFSLIYNGIDLCKFRQEADDQQLRCELGLAPDSALVGMIGRLDEQKNPLDLIRAAAIVTKSYENVQFLIIGDGALRSECEQLIEELHLKEKFFLLGYRNDVARILPKLTITAMSSLWEGLPLAFMEAMSAGKPIVANNIDGARDVVVDWETGFLVPPHQPQAMAERIITLLNDDTLRNHMGCVAKRLSENYSLDRMVEKVEILYRDLYATAQSQRHPLRNLLARISGRSAATSHPNVERPKQNLWDRIVGEYGRFRAYFSERRLLLSMGDAFSLFMAQLLMILLWNKGLLFGLDPLSAQVLGSWYIFPSEFLIWFSLAWLNDLYHIPSSYKRTKTLKRILKTTFMASLINAGMFFVFPKILPREDYYFFPLLIMPLVAAWRCFYAVFFKLPGFRQRVLLVGNVSRSRSTLHTIEKSEFANYDVIGYVHDNEPKTKGNKLRYLGNTQQLPTLVNRHNIHEIVVTVDGRVKNKLLDQLVECQAVGVQVDWLPEFYERLYQRLPMEQIDPSWALYMMQNRAAFNRMQMILKRLLDLMLVLFFLPAFLLILTPIALAIKLESRGPVFYRQVRCGRAGTKYTIFKFRTMIANAEKEGGARWATANDSRITRVGHLLRKTRLDELPQLINVILGDMSMVGPRPERPEFVEQLEEKVRYYRMRLLVKPGITGWAQINYEYGNSIHDAKVKLEYDLYYVRYWSIRQDLYILFRTIGVMLQRKGT